MHEHLTRILGLLNRSMLLMYLMATSRQFLAHIRVVALSLDSNIMVYLHGRCALVDNLTLDGFKSVKV